MTEKKSVFLETHNINNRKTGLGTFNYELIKGLNSLDFNTLELHLSAGKPHILENEFGNKFKYEHYFGFHRYESFRPFKKYDLWHSLNQNTKVEPRFDTNYLLTVHDVNFVEEISADMNHKRNRAFIEKLKKSTAITYISEFAKKQTHQYFDVPKVPEYIIYNGNPISTLLNTTNYIPKIISDKPYFFSIGDFIERKNFLSIVKMMLHIPNYNLIIAGNSNKPYGEDIKNFIKANKLETRVFLAGKISEIEKQYYLKNCLAFLFPSIREGFGLPPIEAMKFSKPVFLSDKTSLPEIGGENAYYWKNFDPEYMKDILFDSLNNFNDNKLELELLLKNRADSFDWKIAATQYLNIYNSILI